MRVFDGHLDLAMNALVYERDQTLPVAALRQREAGGAADGRGLCSCSLDAMRRGGVRLCVATVLARAKPWVDPGRALKRDSGDWPSPDMAHAVAAGQLAYYELLDRRGDLVLIRDRAALAAHARRPDPAPVGVILTMEGADAITGPGELAWWHARGIRTLMLAHFGRSHYAHGTPSTDPSNAHDVDGPLVGAGRALLGEMDRLGLPLDLSHLSDRSFEEAADVFAGAIYASHSACRALVPGNEQVHPMRMLTDAQITAITARGGVIGLPMFNAFLKRGYLESDGTPPPSMAPPLPPRTGAASGCAGEASGGGGETSGRARVTSGGAGEISGGGVSWEDVAEHVDHVCQLAGGAQHVALGSDLDGGFGAEHTPMGLETAADWPGLAAVLSGRGYSDGDIAAIMSGNWSRFFARTLPAGSGGSSLD